MPAPKTAHLKVEMWPAAHGDALWVEYGSASRPHRMLIDAGPINAFDDIRGRLETLTVKRSDIELFVITHIDADHIDGAVAVLNDPSMAVTFGDIWFNAWQQLDAQPAGEFFQAQQGEFVAALISLQGRPWNKAFANQAVCIAPEGKLPVVELAGDARITLLSPGERQLRRLRRNWEQVIADAGWTPGDTAASLERLEHRREYQPLVRRDTFAPHEAGTDNAVANGSSIAFVFEWNGRRCLFTGDAFADVLTESLRRYAQAEALSGPIAFDVVKLPHHGSIKNWTPELQDLLTAKHYLISTSGARFRHPSAQTLELIMAGEINKSAEFWFNYSSETTQLWQTLRRRGKTGFLAHYPPGPGAATTLQL